MTINDFSTNGERAARAKGDALMFIQQQQVHHENSEDRGAAQGPAHHLG